MIRVSEAFKNAIKSTDRCIHGYVDVQYQNTYKNLVISNKPTNLNIVDENGMLSGVKIMTKYATLEDTYANLDGSYMVWNENVILDTGYISNDTFENINNASITITNLDPTNKSKGITIYFKENMPLDFSITFIDNDDVEIKYDIHNNQLYTYQHIFSEEIELKQIIININAVEHPKNRLRIAFIDFNVGDLYENDELIGFEVEEEIDLLLESLPINNCTINLTNYPDTYGRCKFDPINPQNITRYLTDDVILEPYIGVLTETEGYQYVKMGSFYLNDWKSNNNGSVTLNGQNVLSKIKNIDITSDGNFLTSRYTGYTLADYFHNMTGYDFSFMSGTYYNHYLQHTNLLDYLRTNMSAQVMEKKDDGTYEERKFYVTRDNLILEDLINKQSVGKISREELQSDVQYTTKSTITKVDITDITTYSTGTVTQETVLEESYTLNDTEEYIWFKFQKNTDYRDSTFSYSVVSGSGSATLIDKNYYMLYVKFTGQVGSVIRITYTGYTIENVPTKNWIFKKSLDNGDTFSLDYHEYFNFEDSELSEIAEFYLRNDSKYKVHASTYGDPSLEAGDTIFIQTRYKDNNDGYKDIIITKQKFTYDGGLRCDIDGMGN